MAPLLLSAVAAVLSSSSLSHESSSHCLLLLLNWTSWRSPWPSSHRSDSTHSSCCSLKLYHPRRPTRCCCCPLNCCRWSPTHRCCSLNLNHWCCYSSSERSYCCPSWGQLCRLLALSPTARTPCSSYQQSMEDFGSLQSGFVRLHWMSSTSLRGLCPGLCYAEKHGWKDAMRSHPPEQAQSVSLDQTRRPRTHPQTCRL